MTASPLPSAEEVRVEAGRPGSSHSPDVSRPPSFAAAALIPKRRREEMTPPVLALTIAVFAVLFYFTLCAIFESSPSPRESSVSASDIQRLEKKVNALSESVVFLSEQLRESHDHIQTLLQADRQQAHSFSAKVETKKWSSFFDPKQGQEEEHGETTNSFSSSSSSSSAQTPPQNTHSSDRSRLINPHTAMTGEDVYWCVTARMDLDKFNDQNETPLISAIKRGIFDVVFSLLALGANPNHSHSAEKRPIHWAAQNGEWEMIEELVKKGANINDLSREGTPLMIASQRGHAKVVDTLLRLKANTEFQDKHGWTPLMRASYEGHIDVVDRLLGSKAKVNTRSSSQFSPLSLAAEQEHLEIMNMLALHGADVNFRDSLGWTILMRAVANGKPRVAERLIGLGCDKDLQRKDGKTALMMAAEENKTELVRLLLDRGADAHIVSRKGQKAVDLTQSKEIRDLFQR